MRDLCTLDVSYLKFLFCLTHAPFFVLLDLSLNELYKVIKKKEMKNFMIIYRVLEDCATE